MSQSIEGDPSQRGEEESTGYTKTDIFPGRILGDGQNYPGQPAAYFVRAEGTTDTQHVEPGSLENQIQELFGWETLDFMAGMHSPAQMKAAAEKMRDTINNPEMQKRIRDLFEARQRLHEELRGR